jgi:PKD repeat protein
MVGSPPEEQAGADGTRASAFGDGLARERLRTGDSTIQTVAGHIASLGRPLALATMLVGGLVLVTVLSPMRSLVPAAFGADPRTELISVTDPQPVAAFTVTGTTYIAGRPVAFVNTSLGDAKRFAWTFGDGTESTDQQPTHTYAAGGRFTVTLTARSGATSSVATRTVFVIPAWGGSMNLYRSGVFSTQATYTWCVPTSAQIMVNIIKGRSVHSATEQYRWYKLGRQLNRYRYPWAGVDPTGFAGILNTVGAGPYRVYAGTSYQTTLRYAALRMRLTGKPVGLFVGHGSHAWVLNGFTATADPAVTSSYTVTSVNVMGPLWPKQTRGYWDMAPNTRLSNATFARLLTRYDDRIRTVWDYRYVVIVP